MKASMMIANNQRRRMLKLAAGLALATTLPACSRSTPQMTDAQWDALKANLQWMEAIAKKRGWRLTPLSIAPPASGGELLGLQAAMGKPLPPQLRALLERSSRVSFGWHIPSVQHPLEQLELPTSSGNRDAVWDLAHIRDQAVPEFRGWVASLQREDLASLAGRPAKWDQQFPFYTLINGDVVTIDVSSEDGPQPVRYFSHELDMLHGMEIAPDLFTFVTELSRLGMGGTEWASWMPFGKYDGDTFYLRADSEGGKRWRAWLEKDPADVAQDEPPPSVVASSAADRALLDAARDNDLPGVERALAAGPQLDAVNDTDWFFEKQTWDEEFCTALNYAARHDNLPMIERLIEKGATINTRRLVMDDAVQFGSLATVRWLIDHGARVNGWKAQRHWPLHLLIEQRRESVTVDRATLKRQLLAEYAEREAKSPAKTPLEIESRQIGNEIDLKFRLSRFADQATYDGILEALLQAGADPDARWDNHTTILMRADVNTAQRLLKHGADIHARDSAGYTVLHYARSPELIRLFAEKGADVNALAVSPDREPGEYGYTPLQGALMSARRERMDAVMTFLDVGADPLVRSADGESSLVYCSSVESLDLMLSKGLDPLEKLPGGGTLLHYRMSQSPPRTIFPEEVALLDRLLALGLPINGLDNEGRTPLHLAADRAAFPADIDLLVSRGADRSIRDKAGKLPVDYAEFAEPEIRKALMPDGMGVGKAKKTGK